MEILRKILLTFILIFLTGLLSACDIEPSVIKERMFLDTSSGGGGTNIYTLEPGYTYTDSSTTPPTVVVVKDRLCAKIEDLVEAKASGPTWLQQDEIDPATGQPSGGKIGPIAYVMVQIDKQLDKGIKKVFESFANDSIFKDIVILLATLAVIFYGIGIIAGIIPTEPYPLIITVAKITVIVALVTNYTNFEEIVKNFFEGMVDGFVEVMSNTFSTSPVTDQTKVFNPADEMFAKFFSMEYVVILLALLKTGWTGAFYAGTMLLSTIGFLFAVLRAVYVFLIAMVARGLLYAIAPVFITLGMLKVTKSLFEGWLQQLTSFTLQPILLFAFLGVFLEMIKAFTGVLALPTVDATHVCYMESDITLPGTDKVLYWWAFTKQDGLNTVGGITPEISIDLVIVLTFLVLSFIMVIFGTWAVEVAGHMAQGLISSAGPSAPGWATIRQTLLKPVSETSGAASGIITADVSGGAAKGSQSNPYAARRNPALKE